jgi:type I restriction enzyme S subunit
MASIHPDPQVLALALHCLSGAKVLERERAKAEKKYKAPEGVDTSEVPELPVGWCWARMEDLVPPEAPIVYGIIQPGPHISGGVPYVRPADIEAPNQLVDHLPRTTPEIAAKYDRASLAEGDLVYSIVGTIGKWFIVPNELEGANITQSSVRLRPMPPLTAGYLLRALQSPVVFAQVRRLAFGNAVQRLNVSHVRELAIPLAPEREQSWIVDAVSAADRRARRVQASAADMTLRLGALDRSILAQAFRGDLVPGSTES